MLVSKPVLNLFHVLPGAAHGAPGSIRDWPAEAVARLRAYVAFIMALVRHGAATARRLLGQACSVPPAASTVAIVTVGRAPWAVLCPDALRQQGWREQVGRSLLFACTHIS